VVRQAFTRLASHRLERGRRCTSLVAAPLSGGHALGARASRSVSTGAGACRHFRPGCCVRWPSHHDLIKSEEARRSGGLVCGLSCGKLRPCIQSHLVARAITWQSTRTHNSRRRLRRSCWWSGHLHVIWRGHTRKFGGRYQPPAQGGQVVAVARLYLARRGAMKIIGAWVEWLALRSSRGKSVVLGRDRGLSPGAPPCVRLRSHAASVAHISCASCAVQGLYHCVETWRLHITCQSTRTPKGVRPLRGPP
jgi:hypothetical protein